MRTSESTLALITAYYERTGQWPTRAKLTHVVPSRLLRLLDSRVDALVRGGHVTIDATGRIVGSTGTTPTETM